MASISKMKHKPLSERISLFESPSNSPSNSATSASTSPKNSTSSNKPQITKTFSKANLVAIKSQFESGGSTSSTERTVIKTSETKSVVSSSSSHSQQSSAASSLTSTPVPTPTPPLQNSASGAKSGVDSANAQKERRKLPATPKSSSPSTNIASTDKNALKSTGSGGRSAVVASSKQASAGASPAKTPVSRTQPSANKSTHREHTPLHKKSSPNSGTSSASTFGNNVKQRSPTAPIPIAHALKKANNGSHQSDKANNNSTREKSQQHGANIGSNKSNKSSPISAGANSINRVKAPVTKTLSSPLTPPKFATNNVTINVGDTRNNNVNDDDQDDDQSQRLHSTTIQTTTSTIRTNQGISITKQQQNIEVNKINNSYSISQVLEREQSESRKNSQEDVISNEKLMSSSESSSSTSPPSASPPPPPMLAPLIVPTVTVTLDPSNLNNKQHPLKKSPIISENDEVDTTVANNNFKNIVSMQTSGGMNSNSSVTGGRNQQYWTNQALQNDNSKTISEVIHIIISPQRMNVEVMIRNGSKYTVLEYLFTDIIRCYTTIRLMLSC